MRSAGVHHSSSNQSSKIFLGSLKCSDLLCNQRESEFAFLNFNCPTKKFHRDLKSCLDTNNCPKIVIDTAYRIGASSIKDIEEFLSFFYMYCSAYHTLSSSPRTNLVINFEDDSPTKPPIIHNHKTIYY